MKIKKYIYTVLIFLTVILIQSCDYIANPYEKIVVNTTDSTVHERRVLVEDYTGHKCTACPQAAIVANQLKQTYGEKVVVIAVHAGFFATPTTPSGAPT